jgi:N-acetylglucosamine-6-phosphate deacetylase
MLKVHKISDSSEPAGLRGIHYESGKHILIGIRGGIISGISEVPDKGDENDKYYIAPGLIDNQVNGYGGVDFSGEDLTYDKFKAAADAIWNDGVTSFIPTIVTGSRESIFRSLKTLAAITDENYLLNSIPGFHLEGPYLSKEPGFYGCHPLKYLKNPSWREFADYQSAALGKIIEITLAPELEGAIPFIKQCTANGIKVALGHTNASAQQIQMAVDSGACLSTHLGNGCANQINRHHNPIWPQLASDELTTSIIADGHHLLPEELKVFYRAKGDKKLILVSDVTHFIGMESGEYEYMGNRVHLNTNGVVMIPELNCLAGASMPLKTGIETMIRVTGCTMGQAFNLAGGNVADILGLKDRGSLRAGTRADLVLFKFNNGKIEIKATCIMGRMVYLNRKE